VTFIILFALFKSWQILRRKRREIISVNFHFLRTCNYKCGFCFHTALTSHIEPMENIKLGLSMLKSSGMKKINFAGGEPFLEPKTLGEMVRYCKEDLKIESVSIVSNGSKLSESWLKSYAQYVDIIAISCDSFNEAINIKIGRGTGNHLKVLERASILLKKYNVKFKINTVVNAYNWNEDMNAQIAKLAPCRWKVFQVLPLTGENIGPNAKRNVEPFLIEKKQFLEFTKRHCNLPCLVVEDNNVMRDSYLILDEYMRFLNCKENGKVPSKSLLEVGVQAALEESGFNQEKFIERKGIYDWTKNPTSSVSNGGGCVNNNEGNSCESEHVDIEDLFS